MDQATYDRLLARAQRTAHLFTFDEFIRFWAADRPDGVALDGDDLTLTWAELEDATNRVVSALLALGLQKGDRVTWYGKNSTTYFTLFFAAARVGIVMTPVGWRLAEPEAAYIIDNAEAKVLFLGDGFEACAETLGKRPGLIVTTQAVYEAYKDIAKDNHATQSAPTKSLQRVADLGFQHAAYQGIPVVWDPNCTSGRMYYLNREAMKLRITKWELSKFHDTVPQGIDARVARLRCFCALTVSHRRILGQLSNIS